jgi:uncharacterized spore protein YtfJ
MKKEFLEREVKNEEVMLEKQETFLKQQLVEFLPQLVQEISKSKSPNKNKNKNKK